MGLLVATRSFFKCLVSGTTSQQVNDLLNGKLAASGTAALPEPVATHEKPAPQKKASSTPTRSDAVTLLAAFQREARLLDIVTEPLEQYTDEQVGAAARDVIKGCGKVIERMFAVQPLTNVDDGQLLQTPVDFDPAQYSLTGNVTGEAPFSGNVVHHGWKASKCDVPTWSGRRESANIVAPIELELS